jgi:Spy/CpxP family protein refolding chaperone
MKNRKIVLALILSLAFNAAFLGTLGYRAWKKSRLPGSDVYQESDGRKHFHEKLKLTPEQKQHLEEIREEFSPRIKPIRIDLIQRRRALANLLIENTLDSLEIETRLQDISKLQMDIEREVIHQLLREKDLLPQEEWERYLNMIARRMGSKFGPSFRDPRKHKQEPPFDRSPSLQDKSADSLSQNRR